MQGATPAFLREIIQNDKALMKTLHGEVGCIQGSAMMALQESAKAFILPFWMQICKSFMQEGHHHAKRQSTNISYQW